MLKFLKAITFLFCLFLSSSVFAKVVLGEPEVLQLVITRNLELLAASVSPQVRVAMIEEVKARFDTLISGQAFYNLDRNDTPNVVFGTDNRRILWESQATKRFPVGVEGTLGFRNQRDSSNSPFATDPTFYTPEFFFDVRMPLLQNRLGLLDRQEVKISEQEVDTATYEALTFLENKAFEALQAYWNWVASKRYYTLANEFLEVAQEFYRRNKGKADLGLSESTDLLAAEALVLQRKAESVVAYELSVEWKIKLATLLNIPSSENLEPQDKRFPKNKRYLPLEKALGQAFLLRSDYLSLKSQAKQRGLQIVAAKDAKLPRLDFFNTLRLNSVDPSYAQTLGETFRAKNPNWLVGLNFSLSFENRFAKSKLEQAQLGKLSLIYEIRALENLVEEQLELTLREINKQSQQQSLFSKLVVAQVNKLKQEAKKYFRGRSNSDLMVRFQEDALQAQRLLLNSKLQKRLAELQYKHAMGTLVPQGQKNLPQLQYNKRKARP